MHDHLGSDKLNPYEQIISVVGTTLVAFRGQEIVCYSFEDASTSDQDVLGNYRKIIPRVHFHGPLSLAPISKMVMTLVDESQEQYHILIIIASGEISRDVWEDGLSQPEQRTREVVRKASYLPLTIVMAGVGEGPWNMMKAFQNNPLHGCVFDNFHVDILTMFELLGWLHCALCAQKATMMGVGMLSNDAHLQKSTQFQLGCQVPGSQL